MEHQEKKEAPATYVVDEAHWMELNVGDRVFITAKRSGADPYLSDENGNRITDLRPYR